jgi:hypothetical protein
MQSQAGSYVKSAVAALLLALTCAATGQPTAARISGTVTAAAGKPVENAVVTLQSAFGAKIAETKTGVDGRYEFPELKPSVYGLIAKKENYPCAMSSAINATDGSQIIVNLEMKDWSLCSSSVQFTHLDR